MNNSNAPATQARPLDHVVLPVADLGVARARLSALGFTVAPDGVHPFGTANCCVYLQDGTFLEPLAIGDAEQAAASARGGNVFTARDAAYRRAVGNDGFSALVHHDRRCRRGSGSVCQGRALGRRDAGILAAVRRCGGRKRHRVVPPGLRRRPSAHPTFFSLPVKGLTRRKSTAARCRSTPMARRASLKSSWRQANLLTSPI